jgi:hypothetical protein
VQLTGVSQSITIYIIYKLSGTDKLHSEDANKKQKLVKTAVVYQGVTSLYLFTDFLHIVNNWLLCPSW